MGTWFSAIQAATCVRELKPKVIGRGALPGTDRLGRVQAEAAGEHREPVPQQPLGRGAHSGRRRSS
ncbi:hypothetical protein [Streptomyces capitiformicae]|uniref:hypothetical protein n=1 Tax=Streptomyces capitiformicae TaxID=2014920 RepID=UPI001673781E|nr:hypothetical protein [Streptomyces capitiformicae]